MPIEFRCTQCGKLLRTPDDSVGKQARCPDCEAVLEVPDPETGTTPPADRGSFGPPPGTPFASAPPSSPGQWDPDNPYQSPAAPPMAEPQGASVGGPITQTLLDFGDVFGRAWEIYKVHWAMGLAVVLVAGMINSGVSFATSIVAALVGQVTQDQAIAVLAGQLGNIVTQLFQIWISIGQALFFLKTARGQEASLTDLFTGGPYFLKILAATLLLSLLGGSILLLCIIPGGLMFLIVDPSVAIGVLIAGVLVALVPITVLMLSFSQYYYLVLDRNMGIIEALSFSRQLMQGNKLTLFAIAIVGGLLILAGFLACCVGVLAVAPYVALLYAVVYLIMTGQPTADRFLMGPPQPPTAPQSGPSM